MFSPTNFLLTLPFWYFLSRVDFCVCSVCFIYICMMHKSVCIYVCTVLHICIWCAYVLYIIYIIYRYVHIYVHMCTILQAPYIEKCVASSVHSCHLHQKLIGCIYVDQFLHFSTLKYDNAMLFWVRCVVVFDSEIMMCSVVFYLLN